MFSMVSLQIWKNKSWQSGTTLLFFGYNMLEFFKVMYHHWCYLSYCACDAVTQRGQMLLRIWLKLWRYTNILFWSSCDCFVGYFSIFHFINWKKKNDHTLWFLETTCVHCFNTEMRSPIWSHKGMAIKVRTFIMKNIYAVIRKFV